MQSAPVDEETSAYEASLRPSTWSERFLDGTHFVLTRHVLLRLLGLVYLVAFLVAARQTVGLIGPDGLEPASLLVEQLRQAHDGSSWRAFLRVPTLFVFTGASAAVRAGDLLFISGLMAVRDGALVPEAKTDPDQPFFATPVKAELREILRQADR